MESIANLASSSNKNDIRPINYPLNEKGVKVLLLLFNAHRV